MIKNNMIKCNCNNCNKHIYKDTYKIKRNKHNFCSQSCFYQFRQKRYKFQCDYCKKIFYECPSNRRMAHTFCSKNCYDKWLSKNSTKICLPKVWKPKPSPALAYVLGVCLGDGCVTRSVDYSNFAIQLSCIDYSFAQKFNSSLIKIGLNSNLWNPKKDWWRVQAYSKIFYNWYHNLSLEDIAYLLKSKKNICSFIQGFYDSDGDLSYDRRKYNYAHIRIRNTNRKLLFFTQVLLKCIGINSAKIFLSRKKGYISNIYGKKVLLRKELYSIDIYKQEDTKKFLELIGSSIPRKKGEV